MFEIEFRGKLSKEDYDKTLNFLFENGVNLGEDNKEVFYYIFEDKLLKVVNNISQKNAKVSLKMNRIGDGAAFEEIEFHFNQQEFDKCNLLFQKLKLEAKVMSGPQKRINFEYKGCEIAMKYSDVWGYHFEIEKMVDTKEHQAQTEEEIRTVANELELVIMSEEDLKRFVQGVENKL